MTDVRDNERPSLRRLVNGAAIQSRVIGALILREIHTRYGRNNIGFLWFVFEPMMFTVGVMVLWTLIEGNHEHNVSVLGFIFNGYMPLVMWRHCVYRSIKCFEANGSLLYHRQVKVFDLIAARALLEICGVLVTYTAILLLLYPIGLLELPTDLSKVYLGWFVIILFSTACALILAPLSEMSDIVERIIGPVTYFFLPASGAFVMLGWLPPRLREILLLMPFTSGEELIRAGQFGPGVHTYYHLGYALTASTVMVGLGLLLTKRVHRHLEVR